MGQLHPARSFSAVGLGSVYGLRPPVENRVPPWGLTNRFLTNERGRFLPCGAATQDTHTKCRAQKTSTKRVTRCSSLVSLAGHTVVVGTWTEAPLGPLPPAARGGRWTRARQGHRTCRTSAASSVRGTGANTSTGIMSDVTKRSENDSTAQWPSSPEPGRRALPRRRLLSECFP